MLLRLWGDADPARGESMKKSVTMLRLEERRYLRGVTKKSLKTS